MWDGSKKINMDFFVLLQPSTVVVGCVILYSLLWESDTGLKKKVCVFSAYFRFLDTQNEPDLGIGDEVKNTLVSLFASFCQNLRSH